MIVIAARPLRSVFLKVRLTEAEKAQLAAAAKEQGVSMSTLVRELIYDRLGGRNA